MVVDVFFTPLRDLFESGNSHPSQQQSFTHPLSSLRRTHGVYLPSIWKVFFPSPFVITSPVCEDESLSRLEI